MSAKETLTQFERECAALGNVNFGCLETKNDGVLPSGYRNVVPFKYIPEAVREEFAATFHELVTARLIELCTKERRRLRLLARAEAEATLRDLKDEVADG